MNKQVLFTIALCMAAAFKLSAQVQVDHQIQLIGSGANAEITGIKTIINGHDAINDSSVQHDILKYALATGAGTSGSPYVVTLSPALLAGYTTGMIVYFQAPAACGAGPVYVNVNGLGNKAIKKNGTVDLAAGDIAANQLAAIQYDGAGNFEMQSQLGNSSSALFSHYIGQLYGGGIIVSISDSAGYERGLIASLSDISSGVAWTSAAYQSTSAGATSQSNGYTNTNAIITQGATSGAAFLIYNVNINGYTDWYLPSVFELEQVYEAGMVMSKVLGDANGLALGSAYWSSTESSATLVWGAGSGVAGGVAGTAAKSTATRSVRAVRRY